MGLIDVPKFKWKHSGKLWKHELCIVEIVIVHKTCFYHLLGLIVYIWVLKKNLFKEALFVYLLQCVVVLNLTENGMLTILTF